MVSKYQPPPFELNKCSPAPCFFLPPPGPGHQRRSRCRRGGSAWCGGSSTPAGCRCARCTARPWGASAAACSAPSRRGGWSRWSPQRCGQGGFWGGAQAHELLIRFYKGNGETHENNGRYCHGVPELCHLNWGLKGEKRERADRGGERKGEACVCVR